MPIYTYQCDACGQDFERRQSFSDARLSTCESCGSAVRRILHPVGVIFKGSGFYNTDNKKPVNGSAANGESTSGEATAGETKADSPKDAPAETKKPEPARSDNSPAANSKSEATASSAPAKSHSD